MPGNTADTQTIACDISASAPRDSSGRIVPRRVVIETMFGCNATCAMCVINHETSRKKGFMPLDQYQGLLEKLAPYRGTIEKFDLFGLGEPLIDPYIFERVRLAKAMGFQSTAISTNAHLLEPDKQIALLESGIDTVIFSIDGATKETHEAIRSRTSFERVVNNAVGIIRRRDQGGFPTRFVVRFIRQDSNTHEWDSYKAFWSEVISPDRRDLILAYDVHNWSGQVGGDGEASAEVEPADDELKRAPCHHIFEKLVILADGRVALCFEDILEAQFRFGNALTQDPIEVFNSKGYNKIRDLHLAGNRCNLKICSECMVLANEKNQTAG